MSTKGSGTVLRQIPPGIRALGFVSMLMDISSEMIHSLLPLFMVSTLGAFAGGLIEGLAESLALIVKVLSGTLSDYLGKRKSLVVLGHALGALSKAAVRSGTDHRRCAHGSAARSSRPSWSLVIGPSVAALDASSCDSAQTRSAAQRSLICFAAWLLNETALDPVTSFVVFLCLVAGMACATGSIRCLRFRSSSL